MDFTGLRSVVPRNQLAIIVKNDDGTQYCCVECPAKFSVKEKLELHLCIHTKEYRFLCGICGTGLKRKEHLDRHILGHQEIRPHECPECGKAFKRKEHLNIHRTIHSGEKNQVCPLCQRRFYRKDHLQKHLQTHSTMFASQNLQPMSDQEVLDIKQESQESEDNAEMSDEHENVFHPEVLMEVQETNGDESGPESTESSLLIETGRVRPPTEDRPYACPVCGKTYKRKDHLKLHSVTHQKKDKVCTECGKAFHRQDQLISHMGVHYKSYPPGSDDVTYTQQEGEPIIYDDGVYPLTMLPRPVQELYQSERRHECEICHRRFKRKQHLKVHANVHIKNQPTVWCSMCSEGFFSDERFQNHTCLADGQDNEVITGDPAPNTQQDAIKENHYPQVVVEVIEDEDSSQEGPAFLDELNLPVPQKVFVCKYCNKPFKRKDHYKIHLHIHTGVKSFFCVDCGKGFYRKDHLQKHSQIHARVRPKSKKELPDLFPINMLPIKKQTGTNIKPEITIHAPSNMKLRVPLQIKVPYQMVMETDDGEQRAVTIDPQSGSKTHEILS